MPPRAVKAWQWGVRSAQRVGHIMANLQRRTSNIAITFQFFSTLLLWFIKSSSCSSYFEVLLSRAPPADHSQTARDHSHTHRTRPIAVMTAARAFPI